MDPTPHGLHQRLRRGELRHAAWLALRDPLAAEAIARGGVDLVVLDMQHGAIEFGDVIGLLQAVQPFAPALVRLPSVDPTAVTRALDLGADGVVVPLVDSLDDARRAVEAAIYPPAGTRSYGPLRAAVRHGDGYRERVAEHAVVIAMIETANALAAVEEIAAVAGLGGLFVGPADLGLAIGVGPQTDGSDPTYLAARRRVVDAAHAHGLSVGLHGLDVGAQRAALADGVDWVVVASDLTLLAAGVRDRLAAMRVDRVQ
jgi:4-hydroxy-2-oxoheptanedioate aldolase